jgi:hypothetical protein
MTHARTLESAAMVMIGDGVLAAVAPTRHSLVWTTPGRFGRLMHWLPNGRNSSARSDYSGWRADCISRTANGAA